MKPPPPELRAALERAQRAGMLGRDDVERQIAHALDFVDPYEVPPGSTCLDLGSGGGVPGLPLALALPSTRWVLVDAWAARCAHLERAVSELALTDRVVVVHARAEDAAHGRWRAAIDLVVARSFGPPAMTAECAGPLLRPDGRLVVSVAEEIRWPDRVPEVGLVADSEWTTARGHFRAFRRAGEVADRFPRRPSAQRRRPVF